MPRLISRRANPSPLRAGRRLRAVSSIARSGNTHVVRSSAPAVPSSLLPGLALLVGLFLLAGGYLSLEIGADVLHYRISEERAAIERLDEQLRTAEARIDEARRIAPLLVDGPVDLLINP